ncbi:8215_t:CDS:2 [Funneliformis caledonium]|uniref:8215_t:CDS:1 n=1 Tax=Funneliformis caledonium TaxID=1117310 RepID=A0A9N8V893_9GLOM|nr:8215_t:CDS:2 [Funneliformis caledonium]
MTLNTPLSSTRDRLPLKSHRRTSIAAVPQAVYLGLELDYKFCNGERANYAICTHDGNYAIDYEFSSVDVSDHFDPDKPMDRKRVAKVIQIILDNITLYATSQNYKIQAIGLGAHLENGEDFRKLLFSSPSLASRIWLEFDALPFIIKTKGKTVDERASSAVRKAVVWLSPQAPGSIPRISVGFRHEVEVDLNGMIKLVDLVHYEKTVHPATWKVLLSIAEEIKGRKIKASFFNATPQGGGVALMRHALIRLCNLLGLDIHWFVTKPKPDIFDITKRKFHNVLQGVAAPDVRLTEQDKQMFISWSNDNAERFWDDDEGPIKTSDVIIIDDPQVCGIIPYIKKLNPTCKIIYRSHIEICADLIRQDPTGPQADTWNFLWEFISHADLFVSHPMPNFVPDNVPNEKVVLLPACTDPLDGLNKDLRHVDLSYYKLVYNRLSLDQCGVKIDFQRPYIVQVARFDPSKGIPLLIHSFKLFRDKLKEAGWTPERMPSLVICGAGSIDDPDGTPIYEQTHTLLLQPEYEDIESDVSVVRLPPCDQIFNAILRCAHVALQLSTREGFEVKVTEALAKGVPVVAFKAGGIPLQIRHGETGFLADIGNTEQVADYLFTLFDDQELYQRMSRRAKETLNEQYFTVFQTLNWLYLINRFAKERRRERGEDVEIDESVPCGGSKWVKDIWAEEYNYKETMRQLGASEIDGMSLDEMVSHPIDSTSNRA